MKKELIFSVVGYVCLLIVGSMLALWIYTADGSKPYEVEALQYLSYFPAAIASGTLLCLISIGIAGVGLFSVSAANNHISSKTWKTVNTVVTVLLGLILFMNAWSLM